MEQSCPNQVPQADFVSPWTVTLVEISKLMHLIGTQMVSFDVWGAGIMYEVHKGDGKRSEFNWGWGLDRYGKQS